MKNENRIAKDIDLIETSKKDTWEEWKWGMDKKQDNSLFLYYNIDLTSLLITSLHKKVFKCNNL